MRERAASAQAGALLQDMPNVSYSSINVLNGEELGDTPQVSLQDSTGKRSARAGETLLVFIDLPNASPSTCSDIARTLGDGYARAPGGLTSALRLGLKLANNRVLELNKGIPAEKRLEGSLSCALLTPGNVIVAQAGPAVAFARSASGAFEVIAPLAQGTSEIVGIAPNLNVHFNNFAPQVGDVFILSGAHSVNGVADTLVEQCMGKGDARLVAGYLNANVKRGRMVGAAISIDALAPGLRRAPEPASAPAAEQARRPVNLAPEPRLQPQLQSRSQSSTSTEASGPTAGMRASVMRDEAAQTASQVGATVVAGMNQAARSIQRSLGAFGGHLLPEEPVGEAQERSRAATFILAAIAIVLPILIAVAVAAGYFQLSGTAERLRALNTARAQVTLAEGQTDPAQARANWQRAMELIGNYEAKNKTDKATFADALQKARQQMDVIGKVTRIQPLVLTKFDTPAARRIAAAPLGVYILDPGSRAADFYTLNAERTAVFGKKTQVIFTDASAPTTAALTDVAAAGTFDDRWRTDGAVFFAPGGLYEYASASGRASPLALKPGANGAPQSVQAGELYNNAAYLLDPSAGQIWKYTQVGGALSVGTAYFPSSTLALRDGLDLAIDGAIYVLQKGGAVQKYYGRQPVPFALDSLPESLKKVVAIAVSGPDQFRGSVYVLDAVTGAVVELNKTGQFLRQYLGVKDEFINAQDLSFDPTSNTLYVVTPGGLFSFPVQVSTTPVVAPVGEKTPVIQPQP